MKSNKTVQQGLKLVIDEHFNPITMKGNEKPFISANRGIGYPTPMYNDKNKRVDFVGKGDIL
jgi:hypothetical protein